MKTINLFDKEMVISKEFTKAVCIRPSKGSNLTTYEDVEIDIFTDIYDVKLLETNSLVFKLEGSEDYIVSMIPQFFGIPTEEQILEFIRLKKMELVGDIVFDEILKLQGEVEKVGRETELLDKYDLGQFDI